MLRRNDLYLAFKIRFALEARCCHSRGQLDTHMTAREPADVTTRSRYCSARMMINQATSMSETRRVNRSAQVMRN